MEHHFIGIKASAALGDRAATLQKQMQLKQYYKQLPAVEDLHLTLLFLGGWEKGKKQLLWESIAKKPFPSFRLTFSTYAAFGKLHRPRVLFLQPEDSEELQQFYDMIIGEALKLNFPGKQNPFRPHVTIAKKYSSSSDFPFPAYGSIPSVEMKVSEAGLFKVNPQQLPRYQLEQQLQLI